MREQAPWFPQLPPRVAAVVATPEMWVEPLHPDEANTLGEAVASRRREFQAGRACARRALAALGLPAAPLPRRGDRLPRWPPAVLGSISHCPDHCAAVMGKRRDFHAIGLDAERPSRIASRLGKHALRICTPREWRWLEDSGAPDSWLPVFFGAKEAAYKCYFPATRTMLEWTDLEIALDPDQRAFGAIVVAPAKPAMPGGPILRGRYRESPDLVVAFAWAARGVPA